MSYDHPASIVCTNIIYSSAHCTYVLKEYSDWLLYNFFSGMSEDTLRNFTFNFLAAVLILEFLSGINLIIQTSALEVVTPAMPPSQVRRPFHYMASRDEVLIGVSVQPVDGRQRQKKLYSPTVTLSSTHPPISAPSYSSMPGALDLAIYSSDLSLPLVHHDRRLAMSAPAHVDADAPDAASNSSTAPSGLVQPPVSPHNGKSTCQSFGIF